MIRRRYRSSTDDQWWDSRLIQSLPLNPATPRPMRHSLFRQKRNPPHSIIVVLTFLRGANSPEIISQTFIRIEIVIRHGEIALHPPVCVPRVANDETLL